MKGALFVDRDGVINKMVHYSHGWDSPQCPEDVQLVTGITAVISWANKRAIPVIEISNQPGVAKGKLSKTTAERIEARIHELLENAHTDAVYLCPHHPQATIPALKVVCDCRKPNPGLLLRASTDLNISLNKSIFLGDKATDIKAGQKADTKTILYVHTDDESEKIEALTSATPNYRVNDMNEVVSILSSFFKLE